MLLSFGFASIVIGALFMVRRGNFKRLFAYSSVEHMGIIAVALGFGGILGLYGALLQMLNHALAKAVLFLSSGDVSLRYRTREAGQVSGLLAAVPLTGGVLMLATFAVLGSPPFGLFLSELTIVRAGFAGGSPVFPLLLLALLGLAFVAFARTTAGMVTGSPPDQLASPYRGQGGGGRDRGAAGPGPGGAAGAGAVDPGRPGHRAAAFDRGDRMTAVEPGGQRAGRSGTMEALRRLGGIGGTQATTTALPRERRPSATLAEIAGGSHAHHGRHAGRPAGGHVRRGGRGRG